MSWDDSVERLLQKYCDEAQTREALHRRSYYSYKKLNTSQPADHCALGVEWQLPIFKQGVPEHRAVHRHGDGVCFDPDVDHFRRIGVPQIGRIHEQA